MHKHDEIADHLTQEILLGQYREGERLPSERDLAARFEANRGVVREAMKKLEQLGLADIQPGGARVAPVTDASLDVVGHMLAVGDLPDAKLVGQILDVISSLIRLAAESALTRASDEEIEHIRSYVQPLYTKQLDEEAHMIARMTLMGAIMQASGNLVCQIIARSLLAQFAPNMNQLQGHTHIDIEEYRTRARELDEALAARDREAVRTIFEGFSKLNRESVMRAFAAVEANGHSVPLQEVATS